MENRHLAKEILEAVGGKENIQELVHCISRLRFRLKNEELADLNSIRQIKGVISAIEDGGQYQIIVGNDVEKVYAEIMKLMYGDHKERQGIVSAVVFISEIFVPMIGVFAGSGFLKGILMLMLNCGLLSDDMEIYQILYTAVDTVFYYLPVFLGYTAGKAFGTNPFLTMALGAAMLHPRLTEALTPHVSDYANSVFPVIVISYLTGKTEKLLKKVLPKSVQVFLVPAVTLVMMYPLSVLLIGPFVTVLSSGAADIIGKIYAFNPAVFGFLLGAVWIYVVLHGLHWAFVPLFINNMKFFGYDFIQPLTFGHSFAVAGAALAIVVKTKISDSNRQNAITAGTEGMNSNVSSVCSAFLGISEPALHGMLRPAQIPLWILGIASGLAGAIAGKMGAHYYGAGLSGIFALLLGMDENGADQGFWGLLIAGGVSFVTAFFGTVRK